jgi:hypothetical protein
MPNYYGLTLNGSTPVSSTAYYYVSVSEGAFYDGAAVTLYPSTVQATYFNFRSSSVQFQAPAGRPSAGITVVTSESSIKGVLGVSPPINANLTLTCSGNGGPIGSVTLHAGQTEVPFNFNVTASESLGADSDFVAKNVEKPE